MLYWLCVIMKHALLIIKYQKRNRTISVFIVTDNYFTSLYVECNAFTHFVLCNDPCSNPFQAFILIVKYPANHISHSCMLWAWFVKKSSSFNHVLSLILSTILKPFPSVELAGVLKYGLLFCVLSWHMSIVLYKYTYEMLSFLLNHFPHFTYKSTLGINLVYFVYINTGSLPP